MPPHTIRFRPDDKSLLSASDDGTVHLWKMGDAKPKSVIQHERTSKDSRPREIRGLDVSPDGKYLATSCMDDTVRLWELKSGREVHKWPGHGRLGFQRFVRFTPDSQRLVSWGDDMRVCTWRTDTGESVHEYRAQPGGEVLPAEGDMPDVFGERGKFEAVCGAISPDASRLVVVGKSVHVFDVASGRELLKFDWPKQTHVRQIEISPDNQFLLMLVWGYGDKVDLPDGETWREAVPRAELRKLGDGELVAQISREDHSFREGAAFSSDSRHVALTLGREERSVVVMKVPDLTEVARIEGFRVAPFSLEFSQAGKLLAVSNENTSVTVYDLEKLPAAK